MRGTVTSTQPMYVRATCPYRNVSHPAHAARVTEACQRAPLQPKSSSPLLSLCPSELPPLSGALCNRRNCLLRRRRRRRPNSPTSSAAAAIHSLPRFLPSSLRWQRCVLRPYLRSSVPPSPPFLLSSQLYRTHIISACVRVTELCAWLPPSPEGVLEGILAWGTKFPGLVFAARRPCYTL